MKSIFSTTILSVVLISFTTSAFAKFDRDKQRSINGTADTLAEDDGEVGLASFSYGVTDQIQISAPTLPLLGGAIEASIKYKYILKPNIKVSPFASLGFSNKARSITSSAGVMLGIDLTNDKAHNLNLGMGVSHGPPIKIKLDDKEEEEEKITIKTSTKFNIEYDYYTEKGNLFFAGFASGLPYLGYTWAWDNVHLGLTGTPLLPIPLPFIYVRF